MKFIIVELFHFIPSSVVFCFYELFKMLQKLGFMFEMSANENLDDGFTTCDALNADDDELRSSKDVGNS